MVEIFAQNLKRLAAHLDKLLKARIRLLGLINHKKHVRSEQHGRAISLKAGESLCITQILAEIDVKHVARILDHNIVVVAIAYAQYVSGHTVSRARFREIVHSFLEIRRIRIVTAQPVVNTTLLERVYHLALLNFFERFRIRDHLDEATSVARLNTREC